MDTEVVAGADTLEIVPTFLELEYDNSTITCKIPNKIVEPLIDYIMNNFFDKEEG